MVDARPLMPGLVPEWAIVGRPAVICCEWNVDDDDDDDGDDDNNVGHRRQTRRHLLLSEC